jgi:hypothetical protein
MCYVPAEQEQDSDRSRLAEACDDRAEMGVGGYAAHGRLDEGKNLLLLRQQAAASARIATRRGADPGIRDAVRAGQPDVLDQLVPITGGSGRSQGDNIAQPAGQGIRQRFGESVEVQQRTRLVRRNAEEPAEISQAGDPLG